MTSRTVLYLDPVEGWRWRLLDDDTGHFGPPSQPADSRDAARADAVTAHPDLPVDEPPGWYGR